MEVLKAAVKKNNIFGSIVHLTMVNFPNNVTVLKNRGQQPQELQTRMKKQKEKQGSVNATEINKMLEILEEEREATTILQSVFQVMCGFLEPNLQFFIALKIANCVANKT